MMPTAELLFFYNLNIFAQSVSIQRDEYAGVSNVFVHGWFVGYRTSQPRAIELAIIKFNEASQASQASQAKGV